jgi:hypothetical protein
LDTGSLKSVLRLCFSLRPLTHLRNFACCCWTQLLLLDEEWSRVSSAAEAGNGKQFTAGINACSTPLNQKASLCLLHPIEPENKVRRND